MLGQAETKRTDVFSGNKSVIFLHLRGETTLSLRRHKIFGTDFVYNFHDAVRLSEQVSS